MPKAILFLLILIVIEGCRRYPDTSYSNSKAKANCLEVLGHEPRQKINLFGINGNRLVCISILIDSQVKSYSSYRNYILKYDKDHNQSPLDSIYASIHPWRIAGVPARDSFLFKTLADANPDSLILQAWKQGMYFGMDTFLFKGKMYQAYSDD